MLSFLVALLQIDPQEHRNEAQLQARAKEIFALADTDHDGEMSIQEIYNYFADVRVNMSHVMVEKRFKQLSNGSHLITLPQFLQGLDRYQKMLVTGFEADPAECDTKLHKGYGRISSGRGFQKSQPCVQSGPTSTSTALPLDLNSLPDLSSQDSLPDHSDASLSKSLHCPSQTSRRAVASDRTRAASNRTGAASDRHGSHSKRCAGSNKDTMSRLAATRQLAQEHAERSERIRIYNLQQAMQPVKEVLAMIDESGIGKMSYHDFYFFLERTNPHMLPAASSIFFTLDRCMNGEVRFKDILRVLYPHAYESELTEMLRLVTKKRQVKGTGSVHHQLNELREIFAVYDEDGSGQLDQQEFLEALMAAGFELAEAQSMFGIIDSNHGGTISLEEFADWYLHHAPSRANIVSMQGS